MRAREVVAVAEKEPADPWPEPHKTPGLELQTMAFGSLAFRDAAFDIAVVPDLTALADRFAVLSEIRRVIGDKGHALIASPNPACALCLGPDADGSSLDYYALYDLLAGIFPSVQMVGQSPFVGYTVADLALGEEEVEIDFDASLLENRNEEIEWFMAICGEAPAKIGPYSVIQIPFCEAGLGNAREAEALVERELSLARLEIGNRGVRIGTLEKDLENELKQSEKARERAVQITKELDEERRKTQKKSLEEEYQKRSQDLDLQSRVRDLTMQLKRAEERANQVEAARDEMVVHMRADGAELDRLRDRIESTKEDAARFAEKEKSLAAEIGRLKTALEKASAEGSEKHFEEIASLENRLKEKAHALSEAEGEIGRREAIIRDLIVELEKKEQSLLAIGEEPNGKIAELEGRLQASNWRVAEMEARNADLARAAETRLGSLEQENAITRELKESFERKLEAAERGARMFEDEANQQAVRAASLKEDLEAARSRTGALENQLGDAALKQNQLENHLGNLAQRVDAAEALSSEAEMRAREAQKNYEAVTGHLQAATTELEGARAQIVALTTAQQEAEASVRRQISDGLAQGGELLATVDSLRLELENEANRSRQAGADAARFAGEVEDIRNASNEEREKNRRLIEESVRAAEAASLAIAQSNERAEGFESELKLANQRADSLETAFNEAQQRVKMLEGEIDRSNENMASYEIASNEVNRDKEDALRQLKQAVALGDSLEKKLEEMRKTVDSTRIERDRANKRIAEIETAQKETAAAKKDNQTLDALRLEVEQQKATITQFGAQNKDQAALLESLTSQLEEREQRATRLERQVRELDNQIKEHEGDIVGWEMELKFRNARISQLETEAALLQQKIEGRALRFAPPNAFQDMQGADSSIWSGSKDDNPEALRVRLGQLNEALGDKDAEFLILHGQMEDADRRMEISRNALREILGNAKFEGAVAEQLQNLLKSMQ